MTTYEGRLSGKGLRFALVVGRFNELISNQLLQGAMDNLKRHDVGDGDVDVAWVPGAFEMPLVAGPRPGRELRRRRVGEGFVRGGSRILNDSAEAPRASPKSAGHRVPVVFGVLTTDTIEQAVEAPAPRRQQRVGGSGHRSGMANLLRTCRRPG